MYRKLNVREPARRSLRRLELDLTSGKMTTGPSAFATSSVRVSEVVACWGSVPEANKARSSETRRQPMIWADVADAAPDVIGRVKVALYLRRPEIHFSSVGL